MAEFTIHNIETAPDGSKPLLEGSKKAFGTIPNLHGVMAESPAVLEAYQTLYALGAKTSLSPIERQVVYQTYNYENNCTYCVAAHTLLSELDKVPQEVTDALRAGEPIPDAKLEALSTFARKVMHKQGWVTEADRQEFYLAGYTEQSVLDVVLSYSFKVLSNYTNHIAETPVDESFAPFAWTKPCERNIA